MVYDVSHGGLSTEWVLGRNADLSRPGAQPCVFSEGPANRVPAWESGGSHNEEPQPVCPGSHPHTAAEISTADKYRCALPSWPPRYLGAPDTALPRVSSGSRCYKSGCTLSGSVS